MSNLSEEEKKAIEYLENRLDILHNNTQWATENSIKVVLNLIEKQQVEINKEKEKNKELEEQNKYIKNHIYYKEFVELNYIPKSKVREKIEEAEEYEKEVKTIITVNGIYYIPSSAYYKIIQEGYKELLQEGDDK